MEHTDTNKAVGYECPYCGANLIIAPESDHCRCRFCDSYIEIQRERVKELPVNPVQNDRDKVLAKNRMLAVILTVILLTMFCMVGSCVNLLSSTSTRTEESRTPEIKTVSCKKEANLTIKGFNGYAVYNLNCSNYSSLAIEGVVKEATVTPGENLKNGDILKIHFEVDETAAKLHHLDIVDTDYEYEVSGLDTYITSFENEDELLSDLQGLAEKAITNKETVFLAKPQNTPESSYLGYVISVDKEGKESKCCLLYEVKIERGGSIDTTYVPVFFKNIYEDAEGNITADYKTRAKDDGYLSMGDYSDKERYTIYGYQTMEEFILNQIKNMKSKCDVYTDLE